MFCTLSLAGELELAVGEPGIRLEVSGAEVGPPERNLAYRAAVAFHEAAGLPGAVEIRLAKRIPAGAGLGGGSSDAAATLLALNEAHGNPLDAATLLRLDAALGSDVPFFVANAPVALAWGRGHRLLAHAGPGSAPALVAMPPSHVSTAAAYARLDVQPAYTPPAARIDSDALGSWSGLAALASNDFERVVVPDIPELATALQCMRRHGAIIAQLTGSGAAVFGVFASVVERDDAARAVAGEHPMLATFPTTAGV